jgi:hypothetical protein
VTPATGAPFLIIIKLLTLTFVGFRATAGGGRWRNVAGYMRRFQDRSCGRAISLPTCMNPRLKPGAVP